MIRARQVRLEGTALEMALSLKRHVEANNARIAELQQDSQARARFTMDAVLAILGIKVGEHAFVFDLSYFEQTGVAFVAGHEDVEDEGETAFQAHFARTVGETSGGTQETQ